MRFIVNCNLMANLNHLDNTYQNKQQYQMEFPNGPVQVAGAQATVCSQNLFSIQKKQLESVVSETYSCVSAPIQYGSIPAFDIPYMQPYLKQQRIILNLISDYVSKELQDSGVKVHTGEGGFYLYVDFENFREQFKRKGIKNSKEMCLHLLDNYNTALLAGQFFHDYDGFRARLAYVDFEGEDAIKKLPEYDLTNQVSRLKFLNDVAPNVKNGIDRMKLWLKDLSK
eukprot:TRINITY_DN109_c0_g1_i1.p2 TRINITY_DN109_c0_g1~~TRINITY_DN109_c0_g1_i1.p2  ORF type:complete len:226 (+),score=27.61 TRINITY_DN109_c0_g1_i1:692-1369(+)